MESSRGRLRGEGGADDCSENCGERWRSANRGEGSKEGDRSEEVIELAAVEDAVEVRWESHDGVVRTMLASSSSRVRRSAATMRKEGSISLREGGDQLLEGNRERRNILYWNGLSRLGISADELGDEWRCNWSTVLFGAEQVSSSPSRAAPSVPTHPVSQSTHTSSNRLLNDLEGESAVRRR